MHLYCIIVVLSMLLIGCAGPSGDTSQGGGIGGSGESPPSATAYDEALAAYSSLPVPNPAFTITVCTHPDWLSHPQGADLPAVVEYAIALLESPPEPDDDPDMVSPDAYDLLTLVLHELLHIKGIVGVHLDQETHGIMVPVQYLGEAGRERMPTAADYRLLAAAPVIYQLEFVGTQAECDVPVGFAPLQGNTLGVALISTMPLVVWLDDTTPFYVPDYLKGTIYNAAVARHATDKPEAPGSL